MIKLIEGGNFKKLGYYYKIYLTHPTYTSDSTVNMFKSKHMSKKLDLPSGFLLTRNNIYCNIRVYLFGFGIGVEIQSKS